jgi:hypothetical protein
MHGVPYQEGHDFGPAAIPTLRRLLADENHKAHWPTIVLTIGFIGSKESFGILRSFTWERFHGEIDGATLGAMMEIPSAMGAIPAVEKSPQVLSYLEKGSNPETWTRLPWSQERYPSDALALLLSKRCISGLSWTGTPEAERILTNITQRPHDERLRSPAISAAKRNHDVAAVGLEAYVGSRKEKREQPGK